MELFGKILLMLGVWYVCIDLFRSWLPLTYEDLKGKIFGTSD